MDFVNFPYCQVNVSVDKSFTLVQTLSPELEGHLPVNNICLAAGYSLTDQIIFIEWQMRNHLLGFLSVTANYEGDSQYEDLT